MACFLSGRSSFISPGPDGTVTLNFNFPGCTTVCQPLFWHSNLHLYSSSQMNTLALVKTWIPLYSFPSSLLSKRGFLHSLALLLNCYLVARRCCYWMCEYGKWLAYFFFSPRSTGSNRQLHCPGRCALCHAQEKAQQVLPQPPPPHQWAPEVQLVILLDLFCLDLWSGKLSYLRCCKIACCNLSWITCHLINHINLCAFSMFFVLFCLTF